MPPPRLAPVLSVILLLGAPAPARADDRPTSSCSTPAARPADVDSAPACKPTLDMSVSFSSAYVFRGYNVFQAARQDEQKWVMKPTFVLTDAAGRWSFGYAAAYQVNGDNVWSNVDVGLGSEQILFVDYDRSLGPRWTATAEVGMYVYPQALAVPLIVEPSAEVWYLGPIEAGAHVSYYRALRPGPLSEDYVYVSPRLGKTFRLTQRFEFDLYLKAGVKLFRAQSGPGGTSDNFVDVLATETLHWDITSTWYAELKGAFAWTNLGPRMDPETGVPFDAGFVGGIAPFWGFALGAEF